MADDAAASASQSAVLDRLTSSAANASGGGSANSYDYASHYHHYSHAGDAHRSSAEDAAEMELSSRDATPISENGDDHAPNHHHAFVSSAASSLQLLAHAQESIYEASISAEMFADKLYHSIIVDENFIYIYRQNVCDNYDKF
jgi:hypothetical protein